VYVGKIIELLYCIYFIPLPVCFGDKNVSACTFY